MCAHRAHDRDRDSRLMSRPGCKLSALPAAWIVDAKSMRTLFFSPAPLPPLVVQLSVGLMGYANNVIYFSSSSISYSVR